MNVAGSLHCAGADKGQTSPILNTTRRESELSNAADVEKNEQEDIVISPTELELATLRRVSGEVPKTAYVISFIEFCERFSYYGTTAVCEYFLPPLYSQVLILL